MREGCCVEKVINMVLNSILYFVTLLIFSTFYEVVQGKPNVVIIVADDLGWNDVGFHGSNQIPTPNIDALAYSGIILNNYYVMPLCTPSRAALLTARHPIHTGMQHGVLYGNEPWGLSLREKILPQYLNEQGYVSHAVGKWHLGHYRKQYTPTYRGFKSHFGYWTGHQDYYDHTAQESAKFWGYDMRRDMNVSRSSFGHYTTNLLTDEAVRLIEEHNTRRPMFLYLAHLAVHSANPYQPLQAPSDVIKEFAYISDVKRRTFAGMLTMLDRSVGALTTALAAKNMLENSIIIFTTDNGGPAGGFNENAASNWPLRGTKSSLWEGGVKGASCIWSPLLNNTPRVSTQLAHIQDWLPTIMAAINASSVNTRRKLDGTNIWSALNDPNKTTYRELLLVIDNDTKLSALRMGKWKLVQGTMYNGKYDRVIEPSGRQGEYQLKKVQQSKTARALATTSRPLPSSDIILKLRHRATLSCNQKNESLLCHPLRGETCLFDVEADCCESQNLAKSHPALVSVMLAALARHNRTVVAPRNRPVDLSSNPKYWGYTWINWKDFPTPPLHRSDKIKY